MISTPYPDPPPAAVAAHHKATVVWFGPEWFIARMGKFLVRCHTPHHGVTTCQRIK